MHWHVLAGQTVFPVQVAVRYNIPLVIWGHHQGLDQVGMYSHEDEVEMTRKYRKEHDLMGIEAEDLLKGASTKLAESDVLPFLYPHDKEIEKTGVRGIYLGNYIRWDSKAQHELMIDRFGYESAPQARTFDTYNDVDCQHYSGIHDYTKFIKWGYGKVTDHACREIRLRRMTREQGISIVEALEHKIPGDLPLLLSWLNMSATELYELVNRFRDPRVWKRRVAGDWEQLDSVVKHKNDSGIEAVRLTTSGACDFRITPSRAPELDQSGYQLLHKGYVHKN
jgi:hypothetical protein